MALGVVSGYPIEQERAYSAGGGVQSFTITLTASAGTPLVAGQPILLFLNADGSDANGTVQSYATPTSSNITWSLVKRSNTRSSGAQGGTTEVWKGTPSSNLTSNEVVTVQPQYDEAGQTNNTVMAQATAVAFTGASATIPSYSAQSSTSAAVQVTVTGTTAGSLVYACGVDWSAGGSVPTTGNTEDSEYTVTNLSTQWVEHKTDPSAGGDYTIGIQTARAGWNMVGVEILASGTSDQSESTNASDSLTRGLYIDKTQSETTTASDGYAGNTAQTLQSETTEADDFYGALRVGIGNPTYATGNTGASAAATFTVTYPTGLVAGDLIILYVFGRSSVASHFTKPASFTGTILASTNSTNGSHAVYYKVSDGSETGTVTVTGSSSGNTELGLMCRVPGGSEQFVIASSEDEAAGTTFTNSGVTPPENNCLVVLCAGFQDAGTDGETTGFSGWTGGTNLGTWTGASIGETSGLDASASIGCALQTTAAATGNISVNHSNLTNNAGKSISFAVVPQKRAANAPESTACVDDFASTKSADATTTQTETATASDAYAPNKALTATESETSTASDQVEKTLAATQTQSETATPSDDQAQKTVQASTETETATSSDDQAQKLTKVSTQSETATASDTVEKTLAATGTQSETATASDTVEKTLAATGTQSETATASDDQSQKTAIAKDQSESAAPADDAAAQVSGGPILVTEQETATPSDSAEYQLGIAKTQSETATASDDQAQKTVWLGTLAETATAADDQAQKTGVAKSQTETATPSDAVERRLGIAKTQAETATASDACDGSTVAIYQGSQAETATPTESFLQQTAIAKDVVETATPSDDASATVSAATFTGTQEETATPADSYAPQKIAVADFIESTTASDSTNGSILQGFQASALEQLTISDSYATALAAAVSYTESVAPTDTAASTAAITRALSESANTSDGYAVQLFLAGAALSTATPSDAYAVNKVLGMKMRETTVVLEMEIHNQEPPVLVTEGWADWVLDRTKTGHSEPWWRRPMRNRHGT